LARSEFILYTNFARKDNSNNTFLHVVIDVTKVRALDFPALQKINHPAMLL